MAAVESLCLRHLHRLQSGGVSCNRKVTTSTSAKSVEVKRAIHGVSVSGKMSTRTAPAHGKWCRNGGRSIDSQDAKGVKLQ